MWDEKIIRLLKKNRKMTRREMIKTFLKETECPETKVTKGLTSLLKYKKIYSTMKNGEKIWQLKR